MKTQKKFLAAFVCCAFLFSCSKNNNLNPTPVNNPNTTHEPALPSYGTSYILGINQSSGNSGFAKISVPAIPGPVSLSAPTFFLNAGVNIKNMSGLAYHPTSNTFWGTTNNTSNFPNQLFQFNMAGNTTFTQNLVDNVLGTPVTDIFDIEFRQTDGVFYAIRGNNQVVKIDPINGHVIAYKTLMVGSKALMGLTNDNAGNLYLIAANNGPGIDELWTIPFGGGLPFRRSYGGDAGIGNHLGLQFDELSNHPFMTVTSKFGVVSGWTRNSNVSIVPPTYLAGTAGLPPNSTIVDFAGL